MGKKNVLICNIGNRDLKLKEEVEVLGEKYVGDLMKKGAHSFRDLTKHIDEHFQLYEDVIQFDIIERLINYIADIEKRDLCELLLFVTDQQNSPFSKSDTIYVYNIFDKYMKKLKKTTEWKKKVSQIRLKRHLISQNPSDYDQMQEFYLKKLTSTPYMREEYSNIYLSLSGGVPAMNTMLMLNGIVLFKMKSIVLYLPDNRTEPQKMMISSTIIKQNTLQVLEKLIDSYDYHAAKETLKSYEHLFENVLPYKKVLLSLLEFAHYRESFNFEEAKNAIRYALNDSIQFRDRLQVFADFIDQCSDSIKTDMGLIELYWNIWILYHRGQFIDVLGRLFRMYEAMLLMAIKKYTDVQLEEKKDKVDKQWLKSQEELQAFLNNKEVDIDRELTRYSMLEIIGFHHDEKHITALNHFVGENEFFDRLINIRNKTIFTHGWEGFSKEKLYEKVRDLLKIKSITELDEAFFKRLRDEINVVIKDDFLSFEVNKYDEMNKVMKELLKIMR